MKYMVISTRERHENGQEWERKEKLQSPVLYKENTQKPMEVLVPGLG